MQKNFFSYFKTLVSSIFLIPVTFCSAEGLYNSAYENSLTADFAYRDSLPETLHPRPKSTGKWHWGPKPITYPKVKIPAGVNPLTWKQDRVIAVATKYIGLPYMHRHIPSQGGLDCSNFTSWVYNYGFGIRFSSNVQKQSKEAGRKLSPDETFAKGDLLFIWNKEKTKIKHVVIYVNPTTIIDSTITKEANGVALRHFTGWYKQRFAFARRIF